MKRTTILIIMFLTSHFFSSAQTASVKGVTADTISKQNLSNTVISLLRSKDSVLYKFTRSDARGNFKFENLKSGSYILLVTYPAYADYVDHINLTDSASYDLKVPMTLKAHLLKDVIVRQTISAIKIKGDTTEYAADSFKVQADASVEE